MVKGSSVWYPARDSCYYPKRLSVTLDTGHYGAGRDYGILLGRIGRALECRVGLGSMFGLCSPWPVHTAVDFHQRFEWQFRNLLA